MRRIKRFAASVRPPGDCLLWLMACAVMGLLTGGLYVLVRWAGRSWV